MTSSDTLIQLFNGRDDGSRAKPSPDSEPRHRNAEQVLRDNGFFVETIPTFGWPWNPAAKLHNAYLGVDPLRALRVLFTRRKAAVVCAHLESGLLILLLRRLLGFRPPVVIWEVPWSPGWKYREIVSRLAIPRADCCVVFSSNQINMLHDRYGKDIPIVFIPFCIDTDFYRPMPAPDGIEPYVFSCGFDAGRDFDTLLDVAARIPGRVMIKAARSFALDQDAHPNVTVSREHLTYPAFRDLYAGASVVVVTTRETPNASGVTTLMEAMAMGKPVIVSNNPALRDYLPPPDAGIVIPVGDRAALQAAITDLFDNPLRAAAMGQKAREFAMAKFHPKVHFQAVANLMRDVVTANQDQRSVTK